LPENESKPDVGAWLSKEWIAKLANSIEMMTEVRPGTKAGVPVPPGAAEIPVEVLWYFIPLNLAADAAIFVGAAEQSWLHIGQCALRAAGVTELTAADARGAYLEIVSQATSGLSQSLAARLGKPVASLAAKEAQFTETVLGETSALTPVEISLSEPPAAQVYVGWSRSVEMELTAPNATKEEHTEAVVLRHPEIAKSGTLDLLMEVELPVSVSFGRADVPLRDVLKLNSGSIVELNRTITDPVEIIVNNCVIARGEVVVVDGNYGVRIQQVISREERLRTLK
jgi:flagellar motor switch protein FliN